MAWSWNRILSRAMHAEPTSSAQIDGYIANRIRPDGPGLALAVVKGGIVVHAAGYGLANIGGRRLRRTRYFTWPVAGNSLPAWEFRCSPKMESSISTIR